MTQSAVSQNNDQPSNGAGEHALSDIHAAMMEELGIGRKDTLPLQDTRRVFPDHTKIKFTLSPKEIAPGVNTWRNAVFDDVDPAEDEIDSIADGQLARIRRRLLNNNYPEPLLGRNRISKLDKGFGSHMRNDRDTSLSQGRDAGRNRSSLPDPPTFPNNPSQPQSYASGANKIKIDKNRLNASIARLRSSIPPAITNKPENSIKSSSESTLSQPKSPKEKGPSGKGKNKSQRLKSHPARPVLQKSAWGALDENAFLAYAIKPTSPTSSSDQNKSQPPVPSAPFSNTIESVNKKSSTPIPKNSPEENLAQHDSKANGTPISTTNTLDRSTVPEINQEVLTPLIRDLNITSSGEHPTTLAPQPTQNNVENPPLSSLPNNAKLVETESQKAAENIFKPENSIWVNLEGRAMVQMDAGLGLPGYARLRGEPGSLFLELQQSDRLVARESLSNDVVLITDTMNPKFNIVFEVLKEQTRHNPVWRISFEFSHIKNEFLRIILNFRTEMDKRNLLQSSTDHKRTILDILDNQTYPFFTSLIHIGTPKCLEENRPNDAQIRTETLNDLSEIGGISHVTASNKAV